MKGKMICIALMSLSVFFLLCFTGCDSSEEDNGQAEFVEETESDYSESSFSLSGSELAKMVSGGCWNRNTDEGTETIYLEPFVDYPYSCEGKASLAVDGSVKYECPGEWFTRDDGTMALSVSYSGDGKSLYTYQIEYDSSTQELILKDGDNEQRFSQSIMPGFSSISSGGEAEAYVKEFAWRCGANEIATAPVMECTDEDFYEDADVYQVAINDHVDKNGENTSEVVPVAYWIVLSDGRVQAEFGDNSSNGETKENSLYYWKDLVT